MSARKQSIVRRVEIEGIDLGSLVSTLCDLGRVQRLPDLGTNGPLAASAGTHSLFHCLFGRDAIRMAMDLIEDFPRLAHATLLELARLQGVCDNERAEEEPGRILHELRLVDDSHAMQLAAKWDFPYYGAVDTTPQWINLLGDYCARMGRAVLRETTTDRLGRTRSVEDSLEAALGWMLRRLDDAAGAGFLWVRRAHAHGLANQVWEDSFDAYYHEDGTLFDHRRAYAPVALQGYTYDALLAGAELLGHVDTRALRARALSLRERVLAKFWQPDLGTFANALTVEADGSLRPARVIASNAGHLLASQLLDGADVADVRDNVIARLAKPDLLSSCGVRTRAIGSARFRAGSYHNGSVWPMDTGVIADGLRRHGREREASDLEQRILRCCRVTGVFPEFVRGEADGRVAMNTRVIDVQVDGVSNRLEQPPQTHQGWTVSRVWRILRQRGAIDGNGQAIQ